MQIYWVGPVMGGIIGAFTYEYTHSSWKPEPSSPKVLRRSFRLKTRNYRHTSTATSTATSPNSIPITTLTSPANEAFLNHSSSYNLCASNGQTDSKFVIEK